MKSEIKTLNSFLEHKIPLGLCRFNRSIVRFFAVDPLFLFFFSVNNSFSMKRMEKKYHDSYHILYSISHKCTNFLDNRTNNKDFFLFLGYSPLKSTFANVGNTVDCHSTVLAAELPSSHIFIYFIYSLFEIKA